MQQQQKRLAGIKEAIEAVEEVFRFLGKGKAHMPAKLYLLLSEFNGDFRTIPAWVEGLKGCGIKWVNVHPQNKIFNILKHKILFNEEEYTEDIKNIEKLL